MSGLNCSLVTAPPQAFSIRGACSGGTRLRRTQCWTVIGETSSAFASFDFFPSKWAMACSRGVSFLGISENILNVHIRSIHSGYRKATGGKIYFLDMNETNEKAEAFHRLTEARGVKTALAKRLGVTTTTINHWKDRGVPRALAVRVAEILKCQPWDISDIAPPEGAPSGAEIQERALRLSPERQAHLVKYLEFLEQSQGDATP